MYKVGDEILCIKSNGSTLEEGCIYTVSQDDGEGCYITSGGYGSYFRFEKPEITIVKRILTHYEI